MKKILYSFLTLVVMLSFTACKKDNSEAVTPLAVKPDAVAVNDSKSGGVYKGVIIGSTGLIKIVLQNDKLIAEVTIDGITKTLAAVNLTDWSSGEALEGARFENGDWKIVFSVNADGTGAQVSATIPGHEGITVAIVKELSDKLVTAFEGTYSVNGLPVSGTWNFVTYGQTVAGIYRFNAEDDVYPFYGTTSNNEMNAMSGEVSIQGTITGTEAEGVWNEGTVSGKWKGKRTM